MAINNTSETKKFSWVDAVWIGGIVVISVINYFLQMYKSGSLPFRVGAGFVNIAVFVGGVIRWALLFGKQIASGQINSVPDVEKVEKNKKDE